MQNVEILAESRDNKSDDVISASALADCCSYLRNLVEVLIFPCRGCSYLGLHLISQLKDLCLAVEMMSDIKDFDTKKE